MQYEQTAQALTLSQSKTQEMQNKQEQLEN